MNQPAPLRHARAAITACAVLVGVCAAVGAGGHPRAAFAFAVLAAAAALSALRELINREP